MGVTAENISSKRAYKRRLVDVFSVESQRRAQVAIETGRFKDEIVPVVIPRRKGDPKYLIQMSFLWIQYYYREPCKAETAFKKDGTVTAGTHQVSTTVLHVHYRFQGEGLELKLPIMATTWPCQAVLIPAVMGLGVIPASRKAMEKAGVTVDDLGTYRS